MHDEVIQFVLEEARFPPPKSVLEIGGLSVNGHVRNLVMHQSWHCVDISPGPMVDEVADAAEWEPPQEYDLVLCLEVFEHTPKWREIIETIARATADPGRALISCAVEPRPAHGAYGDAGDYARLGKAWQGANYHDVPHGEYYQNPSVADLEESLLGHFGVVRTKVLPRGDFQAVCSFE